MALELQGCFILEGGQRIPVWDDPCGGGPLKGCFLPNESMLLPCLPEGVGECLGPWTGCIRQIGGRQVPTLILWAYDTLQELIDDCCGGGPSGPSGSEPFESGELSGPMESSGLGESELSGPSGSEPSSGPSGSEPSSSGPSGSEPSSSGPSGSEPSSSGPSGSEPSSSGPSGSEPSSGPDSIPTEWVTCCSNDGTPTEVPISVGITVTGCSVYGQPCPNMGTVYLPDTVSGAAQIQYDKFGTPLCSWGFFAGICTYQQAGEYYTSGVWVSIGNDLYGGTTIGVYAASLTHSTGQMRVIGSALSLCAVSGVKCALSGSCSGAGRYNFNFSWG